MLHVVFTLGIIQRTISYELPMFKQEHIRNIMSLWRPVFDKDVCIFLFGCTLLYGIHFIYVFYEMIYIYGAFMRRLYASHIYRYQLLS